MSFSLRPTVCRMQPSRSAISWSVYPSIFHRATDRSVSSPRMSRRCRHSSVIWAARSGVGPAAKEPIDLACGQVREAEDSALAPGGGALVSQEVHGLAHGDDEQELPEVVAVGQGGKRPASARRQRLSKAASATSSSSAERVAMPRSLARARRDEAAEVGLPEGLGGRAVAAFEHSDQAGD